MERRGGSTPVGLGPAGLRIAPSGPATDCPVVQVVTRLNIGGVASHVLLLARCLGVERPVTVVAGRPAVAEGELTDAAVRVQGAPLVRPVRPFADARAVIAVRHVLRTTGAGIVHTHMAKAGTVGRLAALSTGRRIRTVHTFHGHVLDGYFSPRVQRGFIEVERRLASRTDALIAVSDEIRDALLDLGIGRPDQYRVIPYGLDLDQFLAVDRPAGALRRQLGLASDVPLVGIIGRLVPIKDVGTLLAAVARLPGVHLAVVGDGELRADLEAKVRGAGLSDRVHFAGWVTDVAGVLSDLDVVALTSRNEGTPFSLIEAAAAARPVVATRVGGVPTVVDDGVTGFLAAAGDDGVIADHIGRLLADPGLRAWMGQAARSSVVRRFDQEVLLTRIRDLYASLG